MKMAGVHFAPTSRRETGFSDFVTTGGWAGGNPLDPPSMNTPVFADDAGNTFVELPSAEGISRIPFVAGSPAGSGGGGGGIGGGGIGDSGGFLSMDRMPSAPAVPKSLADMTSQLAGLIAPSQAAGWLGQMASQAALGAAPGGSMDSALSTLGISNPLSGTPMGAALQGAMPNVPTNALGNLFSGGEKGSAFVATDSGSGDMGQLMADIIKDSGWAGPLDGVSGDIADALDPTKGGCFPGADGDSQIVADPTNGGCFGKEDQASLESIGADALDGAADKMLEDWKVDDESSVSETIANKVVKDNKEQIKDAIKDPNGFLAKIKKLISGEAPGAGKPAVRISDTDDSADISAMGVGNIIFEGLPVSRITDMVTGPKAPPPGKPILEGAATVLSAALPTAFLSAKTAVPSAMIKGAATILVGGAVAAASPPSKANKTKTNSNAGPSGPASPNSTNSGSGSGGGSGSGQGQSGSAAGSTSAKDGKRNIGGFEVNPDDPHAVRNAEEIAGLNYDTHDPTQPQSDESFRIDGDNNPSDPGGATGKDRAWHPDRGMSLSPEEYNQLKDTPWLRDLMQADGTASSLGLPTKPGNWYLLGGLIDLGSPMNPGAGNSAAWWVPDSIFGMDMSPYYLQHDWTFRPEEFGKDGRPWYDMFTEWEIPSFITGLESTGGNPVHAGLQVLYSGATSIASMAYWFKGRGNRSENGNKQP